MAFLFHRKKSCDDLLKTLQTQLAALSEDTAAHGGRGADGGGVDSESATVSSRAAKAIEKLSTTLDLLKVRLYGDAEHEPKPEDETKIIRALSDPESDTLKFLIEELPRLEFEARKDATQIVTRLLRMHGEAAVPYFEARPELLHALVRGYSLPDVWISTGNILREVLRHKALCRIMLSEGDLFYPLFDYVQLPTFDISTNAFSTFKQALTMHKDVAAEFLLTDFDRVFAAYNQLLQSENYVTVRQSLRLLGEMLLDRSNFKVMMRYINDPQHLKIIMNLLRKNTKATQFEAFHVFKIFVANPKKAKPIHDILYRNRERLIKFLGKFQTDKDDEQFVSERQILLQTLGNLEPWDATTGAAADASAP